MTEAQNKKPTFADIRDYLDREHLKDQFIVPSFRDLVTIALRGSFHRKRVDESSLQIFSNEIELMAYNALCFVHGIDAAGGKGSLIPEIANLAPVMERKKQALNKIYLELELAEGRAGCMDRFEELRKRAYLVAQTLYPQVPEWKPSPRKIRTHLEKALMSHKIRLPISEGTGARREHLRALQKEYIEAVASGIIHGEDTELLFGTGYIVSTPCERKGHRKTDLELECKRLNMKKDGAVITEKFRELDAIAANLAQSIYGKSRA